MARKGSIAASRDIEQVEIARKGSVALARDLERGDIMLKGSISKSRSGSAAKALDTLFENQSGSNKEAARVREEEIREENIDAVDYGTMDHSSGAGGKASRTRPAFVRQDTSEAIRLFKHPDW